MCLNDRRSHGVEERAGVQGRPKPRLALLPDSESPQANSSHLARELRNCVNPFRRRTDLIGSCWKRSDASALDYRQAGFECFAHENRTSAPLLRNLEEHRYPRFARGASPAQTIRHHPRGGPQRPEMFSRLCFDIQGPEGYTPSRRRMLSMISGGAFLFDGACLEQ